MATVTLSLKLNIQMDALPSLIVVIPNRKRNQFQDQEQEVMMICHLSFIFIRVRNLQGHRRWLFLFPATRTTAMAIETEQKEGLEARAGVNIFPLAP